MYHSGDRINNISDYISAYENKIKLHNSDEGYLMWQSFSNFYFRGLPKVLA